MPQTQTVTSTAISNSNPTELLHSSERWDRLRGGAKGSTPHKAAAFFGLAKTTQDSIIQLANLMVIMPYHTMPRQLHTDGRAAFTNPCGMTLGNERLTRELSTCFPFYGVA